MLKKIIPLFLLLSFFFHKAFSQDFLGLSTGNYSGITGVSLQPASIVDSRFKFDLNLFSTGVNYSNNYFLLDKNVLLKFNKNKFDDYESFKKQYLSEATLATGEKVFFNISNRTQLPLSFMATTGKKSAIALNMQFRTMVQGRGISQDFANLAFNNFYHPPLNNTSIDASGISVNSLSWAEAGLTYGRVLFSSDKHFLKAAVTGKYLAGLSSIYIASNDLRLRVNDDSTFNFNSSNVSYNHNENADFNKIFNKDFRPNAYSFGLDAGLVYEYRGNIDKFKYLKTDDETSYDALRRDLNKYIFKLGVSLVDVGMFQFDKPNNVNSFSANINNWDLRNAHYNSINEFDTALAKRVMALPNDPGNYNVYLPTALSGQLDVRFVKGLALNVMSYWPVNLGDEPGKRFDKFGYYTITPRFETRHFGIYIPYTVTQRNDFTDYKQHLLGATLRIGPLFIGSSNLGSMLFNNKLKAADVHVGLKVGFTYGKPNKSTRVLNKIFKEGQTVERVPMNEDENEYKKPMVVEGTMSPEKVYTKKETRVIVDYKDGKIYDNPDVKQNVTIINNYYYGNVPAQDKMDTIAYRKNFSQYYTDSLNNLSLELARQQNKIQADSISQITSDSLKLKRKQLDSLIKSMQKLQSQMDSTNNAVINNKIDSSTSFNSQQLKNQTESVSANRNMDTLQLSKKNVSANQQKINERDSSVAYLNKESVRDSADKKKDKPALDSVKSRSESTGVVLSNEAKKTDKLSERSATTQNSDALLKMQDSIKNLSDRYTAMTDSLTRAKNTNVEKANNAAVVSAQENLSDNVNKRDLQNETDSKNAQRLQAQQNELLQQYARQSDLISKDIDRLNSRISDNARNDRRRNNNYIPVPIPVNNSRKQEPVAVSITNKTDTVYIRDTVNLRDTVMMRDSIKLRDTIINLPDNSKNKITVSTQPKKDTVLVKEIIKQPKFDYTTFPEENVLFAIGKWTVQPSYDSKLNFIANILKKNPEILLSITGHTDSTGSRAINEKLSVQRAQAVADYLMNQQVPRTQIILKSQSFTNPAVTGSSTAARSQNRRVALKMETAPKNF